MPNYNIHYAESFRAVRDLNEKLQTEIERLQEENIRLKKAILSYGKGSDFDWDVLRKIDQLEEENTELRRVINELREYE